MRAPWRQTLISRQRPDDLAGKVQRPWHPGSIGCLLARGSAILMLLLLSTQLTGSVLADDDPPPVAGINPVQMSVPSIGIDARIQYVGLTPEGSMEIPSNFTDVAWFSLGYRPGEPGNAVFDGHVSSTDQAAVFFYVQDLRLGANIYITGDDGSVLTFQVADLESYPLDSAPLDTMFGSSGWPQVVLITCGGEWHEAEHIFDHRTVVYAPLVAVSTP